MCECVCRGGGAVCGRVDGEHHVKQKPINTKCTNIIHACTLNCYMRQQRRLLIRVTSVPSLISSRPVLGSRSKPGLKALAWARFGCVKNVHYINIWYPPKPIQSVILDRLSSRWCTNPRQSDESRSDNSRGKSCPLNVGGNQDGGSCSGQNQAGRIMGKRVCFNYSCLNKAHFRYYYSFNHPTPFIAHFLLFLNICLAHVNVIYLFIFFILL